MTASTAEVLIEKALLFANGAPCAFVFQGGEPTLAGLDYFRHFTEYAKKNNTKKSPIFYSIQTNGTMLHDAWAEFFTENQFLVGLSLDGSKKHNKFRMQPDGQNSFNRTIAAAELLKKHKTEFNILTVLTGYAADHGEEIYRYFRSKGFRYLQFIPCLRPFGSEEESELYMTADQYANFLIRVFRLYTKDYIQGNYISVRQFDNLVRLYLRQPVEQCGMQGRCAHQFVAESNGNIYPCDFYCMDEYLLGNILQTDFRTMAESDSAKKFIRESIPIPDACKKCSFYPLCRAGGCKRTRLSADYCAAYRKFFRACLPLFRKFIPNPPRS